MSTATIRRHCHQVIYLLAACALIGCFAMVGGAWANDREINSNPGRALATVTDVGILRTTVNYPDDDGVYHSPGGGLLYPSGLGEGQRVWVTYARHEPELVKVEGREWTLSIIPALSVAVVSLLIAGLLWLLVNRLTALTAT